MKKHRQIRDFDYWIDEYMYHCRSRKLRPKTMQSYEQTLRLFERWCREEENIQNQSWHPVPGIRCHGPSFLFSVDYSFP